MKINSIYSAIFVILCMILSVLTIPVIADDSDTEYGMTTGSPRQNYLKYYNKTFNIDSGWEWENVSVVVFVQTTDQTVKADSSGSYSFNSAETLQSTVNDLDGGWVSTGTTRHVLAELFTSENCVFCPGAVGAMDRIARDPTYYPSKMSLIEWHPNSGNYKDQYGFPESDTRLSWYFSTHSMGFPTSIFDGDIEHVGGSASGNTTSIDTTYKNYINTRTSIASPLDITTRGVKDNTSGWINVSVELANPTPIRNLEVNFVVVEDIYPAKKEEAYYRFTARNVLTSEAFSPPNHEPAVQSPLSPINIQEDTSDSTTIDLDDVFIDDDLDELVFSSDKEGSFKEHITVAVDIENKVTLTPDDDWNGVENITFYADDGRSATPTSHMVKVTINQVNDLPYIASAMSDFNLMEDTVAEDKYDLNVVFDDTDTDPLLNAVPQEPLVFDYSGNEHIIVSINSGLVTFTPETQWNGEESITFKATDPSSSYITDEVKVTVKSENDPPVMTSLISDIDFDEDTAASEVIDLNDYFIDPDGDSLTFSYSGNVNIYVYIDTMGKVTLTPEDDYNGQEMLTFTASDNIGEPVSTYLNVTVNPVNDAPILNNAEDWNIVSSDVTVTSEDTIKIDEDDLLKVIVTASDPADGDTLTYSDDTELFDINTATGEISFTPTNDDVGTYKVNITVDDGATQDNTDSMIFKFVIENTNDPPGTPTIVSPSDGDVFTVGDRIDFKGTCDDPDLHVPDTEEVLSYIWTSDAAIEDLGYGDELSLNDLEVGEHQITLTVKDKRKEESSASITITVEVDKMTDTDSDGIPDYTDEDDDNDGMPDEWEIKYKFDPLDEKDAVKDSDGDSYSNLDEYLGEDGQPGGDDSTHPLRDNSFPSIAGKSGSDDEDDLIMGMAMGLVIGLVMTIIIIIVVVLILFMMMRKKKPQKDEQPEEGAIPPPTEGEDQRVPEPGAGEGAAEYGMVPPPPGMMVPPPPMAPPQDPGMMYSDPYQQQPMPTEPQPQPPEMDAGQQPQYQDQQLYQDPAVAPTPTPQPEVQQPAPAPIPEPVPEQPPVPQIKPPAEE